MTAPASPAPARRHYRVTYSNNGPDDESKLFQGRDGLAFCETSAALAALGCAFATTIHFYPSDARRLSEFPAFRTGDLLVLPTRPPLTDREALLPPRKIIRSSQNELEKLIFKQHFRYFAYCTRKHIKLTAEAQRLLAVPADHWASLEFFEHSGATHPCGEAQIVTRQPRRRRPRPEHRSTVAFLLRTHSLPAADGTRGLPCGLLSSFGMGGYTTLIWNRYVRLQHPEWLTQPGFVMAEIVFKQPIPERPLTPEFATDPKFIEVNLLTKS